jgi:hypothetical protein
MPLKRSRLPLGSATTSPPVPDVAQVAAQLGPRRRSWRDPVTDRLGGRGPGLAASPATHAITDAVAPYRELPRSCPPLMALAGVQSPGQSHRGRPVPRLCTVQRRSWRGWSGQRYRTSSAIWRLSGRGPRLSVAGQDYKLVRIRARAWRSYRHGKESGVAGGPQRWNWRRQEVSQMPTSLALDPEHVLWSAGLRRVP